MSSDLFKDGLGLPQIRTICITKLNGEKVGVPANQFIPWKFVIDTSKEEKNKTVAYMCCIMIGSPMVNCVGLAKESIEITKDEYDRLVDKYKSYQENNTSMIEGFVDQSEPPEMPNAPWLEPSPVAVGTQHIVKGITPCPELKGAVSEVGQHPRRKHK